MKKLFWMNLLLTIVLGVIGVFLLLNKNYKPIRKLLSEASRESIFETEEYKFANEFDKLCSVYQNLYKEKQNSQQILQKQQKELQNSRLLSYMKGRTTRYFEQEKDAFHLLQKEGTIALAGFMIPDESKQDHAYDELVFFIVDNIFSEMMEAYPFYHVEDGGFIFYIFRLESGQEEAWYHKTLNSMNTLYNLLEEKWKMSIVGSISSVGGDIHTLKLLYQSIMNAFEYQNLAGNCGVIDAQELWKEDESHIMRDYLRTELRTALHSDDIHSANDVFDMLLEKRKRDPYRIIQLYVYDVYAVINDVLSEYNLDRMLQSQALGYLEKLMDSKSINEIKEGFGQLLEFARNAIQSQQKLDEQDSVAEVRNYIADHYTDCNLNIAYIADQLNRNSRLLSKSFRDSMNIGILDYINQYRVEQAKRIIENKQYTLEEVASMVGYANVRTFRRAFVKYTGEVPSQFEG